MLCLLPCREFGQPDTLQKYNAVTNGLQEQMQTRLAPKMASCFPADKLTYNMVQYWGMGWEKHFRRCGWHLCNNMSPLMQHGSCGCTRNAILETAVMDAQKQCSRLLAQKH